MTAVILLDTNGEGTEGYLSERVFHRLRAEGGITACERMIGQDYARLFDGKEIDTLVFFPRLSGDTLQIPDTADTARFLEHSLSGSVRHLIVLSSGAIYGARPHNPGLIRETQSLTYGHHNGIAAGWIAFETQIAQAWPVRNDAMLTVLRPAHSLIPGGRDYFSRLLSRRLAFTLAGHDPSIQWLHPDDLAGAVVRAVTHPHPGIYNVGPSGVMTLRAALRLAGVLRVPTPRWPQRLFRWAMPRSIVYPVDRLDYIRYSWTVSSQKLQQDLGYVPRYSSVDALCDFLAGTGEAEASPSRRERILARRRTLPPAFDDFGLDKDYMGAYSRTLFKFLHDVYWRIEVRGIEHVPREGRALMAGVHRGFMPLDGVMTNYLIFRETGRYPRFLIHPTLIKFPFQFNFMTKIGGIIACQQNADYVLSRDGLVGFYPEGIQGAFRYYRGTYTLGRFGHNEFVRMALRNRAPIIPFVTVGNAEIFPVIAKIKWQWWIRFTLWPAFPIAPPFPFLPIPFPTKWHIQFLEPLHIERDYPPEAADDTRIVAEISQEVRRRMQAAIDDMRSRRKRIFWGSIFEV